MGLEFCDLILSLGFHQRTGFDDPFVVNYQIKLESTTDNEVAGDSTVLTQLQEIGYFLIEYSFCIWYFFVEYSGNPLFLIWRAWIPCMDCTALYRVS